MKKIIEYWMCTSLGDNDLDNYVNEKIREGFQPYGSPFMMPVPLENWDEESVASIFLKDGTAPAFAQAMVKYEND